MAGVYVHIPFCRRACHYCDFHFTTNLTNSSKLVNSIVREIELRKGYLSDKKVETIYFGGGTPSLLPTTDIEKILNQLSKTFSVNDSTEFTLEANPEDLTSEKLRELKSAGVNRLSLGTQSFIDSELKWMNRMHSASQAKTSIQTAQDLGFGNISIDLIFGLPDQSKSDWELNLREAIELNVQHISSYSLTIEEKTVLHNRIQKGEQKPPSETAGARFFEMNMDVLPSSGFEHYEISNYAKKGFISKHNSSYWKGIAYIGLGPSAHSFNSKEREWNVRSNGGYISKIEKGESFSETEILSVSDRINDHILTGLRTKWGIQKEVIDSIDASAWNQILESASRCKLSDLRITESHIFLTNEGKLKADNLTAELFI